VIDGVTDAALFKTNNNDQSVFDPEK